MIQLRYWLAVSPELFTACTIEALPATLGREPSCDVQLEDSRVSRRHLAIEVGDDGPRWVDLGSSNGFRWRGEHRREAPVETGQWIEVGGVVIQVVTAPEREPVILPGPGSTAPPGGVRVLASTRRRRWLSVALPVLLTGVLVGYAGIRLVEKPSPSPKDSGAQRERHRAMEAQLSALEAEFARADAVDATLWRRVGALVAEARQGVNPHQRDRLLRLESEVDHRRRIEFHRRYQEVRTELVGLLDDHRSGAAVQRFAQRRASFPDRLPREDETWDGLERWLHDQLVARHRTFERDLRFLETFGSSAERVEFFARAMTEFEHSAFEPFVAEAVAEARNTFRDAEHGIAEPSSSDVSSRRWRDPSAPPRFGDAAAAEVDDADDADHDDGVSGATDAVATSSATETAALREAIVTLLGESRRDADAPEWSAFSHDELFVQARQRLEDEALLAASAIAFRWGLRGHGDDLLRLYLSPNPRVRRGPAEMMLAEIEGLDEVPTGGYVYSDDHGWESAITQRSRATLIEFDRLERALKPTASIRTFEDELARALQWVDDEGLTVAARSIIRRRVIDRLVTVRSAFAEEFEASLAKPFEQLRAVKLELNERRRQAYEVIMDPAIYLPEDHPDWRRGDVVNGQREVDRVVGAVRELWQESRYVVTVPARLRSRLALFIRFEQEVFPRLRGVLPELQFDVVTELRNNPFATVSLQSYALDAREAKQRDFNQSVREYNAAFRHPDLPEPDRQHVIFMSDHREMMGVDRCFIDIRLCRATWKHSRECDKAARIWHNGPNGTPQSRAQAEGFESPVSENVALGYGSPRPIWTQGWYRASDHHRNAISPGWNCMGYGFYGSVGTQNFANEPPPFE